MAVAMAGFAVEDVLIKQMAATLPVGQVLAMMGGGCGLLFVLICLANQCNIDLTEALRKNLDKKTARDADRHRSNPKLS